MIQLILTIEDTPEGVETTLRTKDAQTCTGSEKATLDKINEILGQVCGELKTYTQVFKDVPRSGP
jgi:hypothetical protein